MDTSAPDIEFDDHGICNYCTEFLQSADRDFIQNPDAQRIQLDDLLKRIRVSGEGKKYDCIVGVSGGLDSSWTLIQAKRAGLRPLAVHMDNGWNSELAQNNIENLVKKLDVDLYTHVIDWHEYKGLMQAFFDADVVDVELLYDNAMLAVNYSQAVKNNVKYILAGTNQSTEGLRMPSDWNWFKFDKTNIKGISKKFGGPAPSSFPSIGAFEHFYYQTVRRHKWVSFLDYFNYTKSSALMDLEKDFNYKRYPYKHYESIFTRFYQGYILPRKFLIDKRHVHFSSLILTGQISREDALRNLEESPYPSLKDQESDKSYFEKKMGWSAEQLAAYLARPRRSHADYPSERAAWERFAKIYVQARHLIGAPVAPR